MLATRAQESFNNCRLPWPERATIHDTPVGLRTSAAPSPSKSPIARSVTSTANSGSGPLSVAQGAGPFFDQRHSFEATSERKMSASPSLLKSEALRCSELTVID